jgi:hypothetical protein
VMLDWYQSLGLLFVILYGIIVLTPFWILTYDLLKWVKGCHI